MTDDAFTAAVRFQLPGVPPELQGLLLATGRAYFTAVILGGLVATARGPEVMRRWRRLIALTGRIRKCEDACGYYEARIEAGAGL